MLVRLLHRFYLLLEEVSNRTRCIDKPILRICAQRALAAVKDASLPFPRSFGLGRRDMRPREGTGMLQLPWVEPGDCRLPDVNDPRFWRRGEVYSLLRCAVPSYIN